VKGTELLVENYCGLLYLRVCFWPTTKVADLCLV